jgi:DNA polymerase bacteriophage-type
MEEAIEIVQDYRRKETAIVGFWAQCQRMIELAVARRRPLVVTLPSGRKLEYSSPRRVNGEYAFCTYQGGPPSKMYGGKLTENIVQAASRDVFVEGLLRLEALGIPVLFHVYDEYIAEVAVDSDLPDVASIVGQPPSWAPDLPVAAEGQRATYYCK